MDVPATAERILKAALAPLDRVAPVVVKRTAPKLTTAEAKTMGIKELVGSYTTIYGGDPNRIHNVQLVAHLLDHHLIAPGEEFSFNKTTGDRNAAKGFLEAPVIMSPNGRGALDDRHPLALTSLAGREILAEADAVLAVGTRFLNAQEQISTAPGARLAIVNVELRDLGEPRRPELAIHGDAAVSLRGLLEHLDGRAPRPSRRAELDRARAWSLDMLARVEPQYGWVRALRASMPEDGILVNEFTQVGYMAQVAYPVYAPRSYVSPGYQGSLGYGFPTALGAKVAYPQRAVLSITGDGGFGWGLAELSTARKYGIGLVTVVFNDGAYGNVRRAQVEQFEGRVLGSDLLNPDFVQLAESFGVRGTRATTPAELEGVLRETLGGSGEPVLIDVPVGRMQNPFRILRATRGKAVSS